MSTLTATAQKPFEDAGQDSPPGPTPAGPPTAGPSLVPGRVALDLVAVVLLTAVALVGLDASYATRSYLVVGMSAVCVVAAWALLCTVRGWSTGVFLLVAFLAYPLVGAYTALHNLDYLGLPSAQALVDTLTATLTAPGQFLTTIPPVDAVGTALVIPHFVGYVFGGAAAWAALRTTRPMLPVLPLIGSIVLCIALGTESQAALLLRAAVFAVLVMLWVVLRARRRQRIEHGSRGRVVRAAGATVATLAAAGVAAALLPHVPADQRVVLRGRVGSGQDVSELDNPLASFRRSTRQPPRTADNVFDRRLLRVTGLPRRVDLRYVALDTYDGTTWSAGNRTVEDDSAALFQRIGQQVGARRPGRPLSVSVEVKRFWTSSWLPLAGQLTGISFDYLDGRAQRTDVRYNVATQTGMVVGGLEAKDDYHFTATAPVTLLTRSMEPWGSGRPLQPDGAFLDRYLVPWRKSGLTPMQQVFSLARYLRTNGRYSDGGSIAERRFLPGHDQARLGPQFIGSSLIVGDDEQYAAFMALAANRLGVPARVVVGSRPDARGWVRGRNVFAWVEIRVDDGSWRILRQNRFMSHRPPKRSETSQPPASYVQRTTRADTTPQSSPTAQQPPDSRNPDQSTDSSVSPLVWLIPLGAWLVGLLPGLKWCRRRRRQRDRRISRRVVGAWQEVLDQARDQSCPVTDGLPRTEQATALGLSGFLARRVDDLVFAREEPSAEQANRLWEDVRVERRRRTAEVGWPRRMVTLWNPRSLLHSWSRRRRHRQKWVRRLFSRLPRVGDSTG